MSRLADDEPAQEIALSPRKYEQRLRAETAQETRRRILDAVYEHLREAPASPVSLDRVAHMAGVARSTVYLVFGSRAGLFDALAADLFDRGGFERVVQATELPDARETVRQGVRAGVRTLAAHRDVLRALYSMAQLEEQAVGGAMHRAEERRREGMALLARRLAEQRALRRDVSTAEAETLLWILTSFDAFDLLYTGRGMSVKASGDALVATAERSLFRDS